jgi:hypothetical protein
MKSKSIAIFVSLVLTMGLTYGIDQASCAINSCVDDDASRRAMAILGIPIFILYALVTWGVMYTAMLSLCKYFGSYFSPALVSVPVSSLLAIMFHDPGVDGNIVNTLLVFLVWLGLPWYCGGLVAILLWPNKASQPTPKSGAAGL